MERKYIILPYSEVTEEIVEQTLTTSIDTLTKSLNDNVIIKYEGDLPSSLSGKTPMTNEEAKEEMKKDESNKEDSIRAITPTLSKEEKLEKDKLRMKDLIYEFYQLDKKNNN